ncbi:unnamed protein product [Arctia plantaginis]|uniref:Protein EFR3 homolog cmp44E n=1 Tax=Arctia plantaginis TaxID=874455 RepID=A0A8S1AIX8_ARCPL|nr:unnamed protein product [Arctia plantaginis]
MVPLRKILHRACFIISRTVYMTCCCGCCSALRPRYKRLVDNIFPASPQDGLVKSNMEKLTFYSLSSPEKLDRIGEYLFQKASRDIYRRRHGFVIIAMEAMDQLLVACHSQTLNLFVESFLKMVQKLLESTDPQLQILATQSFVRFANIEEDTPSYHRRYDFFVSKFSAMCHSNHIDKSTGDKIRLAGIQGLQGVIRKTVSDDLVENIWEAQHMDKIVPSLLYNMQSAEKYETVSCMDSAVGAEAPARLAEACLRELVGRASFGHIRSVLRPVLTHFDRHELWIPNEFAVHTFKIIMFSVQAQYSYSVVEALMQHLDGAGPGAGDARARTRLRAARATVLSNIVAIAAGDSVGPSVLEIINNLLTNLRASVARDSEKESDEKLYQEALINALGEFADHLPDFQKIDIMMFIVNKVPSAPRGKGTRADSMLQSILLKSLLKVGTTYRTAELSKAFPAAFLEALLRVGSGAEPAARALLQRILHTLLDRRANAPRLTRPTASCTRCSTAAPTRRASRAPREYPPHRPTAPPHLALQRILHTLLDRRANAPRLTRPTASCTRCSTAAPTRRASRAPREYPPHRPPPHRPTAPRSAAHPAHAARPPRQRAAPHAPRVSTRPTAHRPTAPRSAAHPAHAARPPRQRAAPHAPHVSTRPTAHRPTAPPHLALQRILHTLLDRRANAPRLTRPALEYAELGLTVEKCSRQDLIFISKHGYALFGSLYDGLQLESNTMENIEAIYTTVALICIELGSEETVGDMLQLVLAIQQSGISNPVLSVAQQCQLQGVAISLAVLVPHVCTVPRLAEYLNKIIEARREEAPHMLPPLMESYDDLTSSKLPAKLPYLMMDQMALCECVKASGLDTARLAAPSPYSAGSVAAPHRHSWLEAGAAQGRDSLADITAGPPTELDSANSSPGVTRAACGSESAHLEAWRRAAGGPSEAERRDLQRRRATLNSAFRTAPFDHLKHITAPKYEIQDKLEEIFNSITEEPLLPMSGSCSPAGQKSYQQNVPPYTKYFPELFLY